MRLLKLIFWDDLGNKDGHAKAADLMKSIVEFVFTVIQCLAIIAGMELLLRKEPSVTFALINLVAYISLLFFLLARFRYVMVLAAERLGWPNRFRSSLPWIVGCISLSVSLAFVFTVPEIVAEFATRNFLQ